MVGHTKWPTENICSSLRRITSMSTVFMCIPCRKKAYIPATSVASANFSACMQLIMMRWGGALGAEHCWAVCWARLLKSFGAEQILHTRWTTEKIAHACVEIKSMTTDFMCIPPGKKHRYLPRPSPVETILLSRSLSWCAGAAVLRLTQCWVVLGTPPIEDFGSISSHAQSTAATYFICAVKSDVVHRIVVC